MSQKNITPRVTQAIPGEIAADAKKWASHKREASYLYTGTKLANIREQLATKKLETMPL